jgi:hypothetical protein
MEAMCFSETYVPTYQSVRYSQPRDNHQQRIMYYTETEYIYKEQECLW